MVDLISRGDWKGSAPVEVTRLASPPAGVKVHYVAGTVSSELVHDHRRCAALVRDVQAWHMDGNGWSDIGYSALVCPHAAVFVGRGPGVVPAANGSGLNSAHYAVCCLLGDKGLVTPPPGMLDGLAEAIRWLRREGDAGKEIKGHRDGYATTCPGDPLYKIVKQWQRDGLPGAAAAAGSSGGSTVAPPFGRVLAYPPVMRGEDVRAWQQQMRRRGWTVDVDGAFGPRSRDVAAEFARRFGFSKAEGRVTRPVWDAAWQLPVT